MEATCASVEAAAASLGSTRLGAGIVQALLPVSTFQFPSTNMLFLETMPYGNNRGAGSCSRIQKTLGSLSVPV